MSVVESTQKPVNTKTDAGIIDCDIHPLPKTAKSLHPYLPKRWQEHAEEFGIHLRQPFINTTQYPRSAPLICRRDAWPPEVDLRGRIWSSCNSSISIRSISCTAF
jgi:hypothetical protein